MYDNEAAGALNANPDAYADEVYLSISFMSIPRDRAMALVEASMDISKSMPRPQISISFDKAMVDE